MYFVGKLPILVTYTYEDDKHASKGTREFISTSANKVFVDLIKSTRMFSVEIFQCGIPEQLYCMYRKL
jgi:hypothetical protein